MSTDQPDSNPTAPAIDNPFLSPLGQAEAALTEAQADKLDDDLDQQFDPEEDVFAVDDGSGDDRDDYDDPDDYEDPGEFEDPHLTTLTAISIRLANIDSSMARIATSLEALAEVAPSLMFAVSNVSDSVDSLGTGILAQYVAEVPRARPAQQARPSAPPSRTEPPDDRRPRSIAEWLERATMPGDMARVDVLKRYANSTVWWATVDYFGISREVANRVLETQHLAPALAAGQYISARLWAIALTALNVEVPPPHTNWAEVLTARQQRLANEAKESA